MDNLSLSNLQDTVQLETVSIIQSRNAWYDKNRINFTDINFEYKRENSKLFFKHGLRDGLRER